MDAAFPPRKPRYLHLRISLGIVALLVVAAASGGCHQAAPAKMSKVSEVVVTTPITDEVTDYQDFTGRMDALKSVDIRPRVSGYVTESPFVEGDIVKEGDLLFQIDPRPYQVKVNQAEANLKLAQADVSLQKKRVSRGMALMNQGNGAIGPEDYDQLMAAHEKAIATVGSMKAALEEAKLNLEFTHVKVPPLHDDLGRPLVGRVSRRMVDPGNAVNADQTILTTLVSIDPMYAYFDVDERTYLELAAITAQGSSSFFSALQFPVLMRLATEEEFTTKGYVNFLDNRLNSNTGTVRMRGLFTNSSGVLKSGLFVRIRLPLGVPYKALMIPDEALMSDQGRKYVYVVKEETGQDGKKVDKVDYRAVQLGQSLQGMRVIKEGIKEGERVIISGMQRVRPGAVVKVIPKDPPPPPQSPITKILKEDRAAKPAKAQPSAAAPSLKEMPRVEKQSSRSSRQHSKK